MELSPGGTDTNPDGTDDNFGPHCRNCHMGASSCQQCHQPGKVQDPTVASIAGKSNVVAQSFYRSSAVADINGQCIDGGFSFPHRTLGANMLKDELWGVDFDGTPVAVGETRDAAAVGTLSAQYLETLSAISVSEAVNSDSGDLAGADAENLDSVCIDCHGDSTYYNPSLANEVVLKGLP